MLGQEDTTTADTSPSETPLTMEEYEALINYIQALANHAEDRILTMSLGIVGGTVQASAVLQKHGVDHPQVWDELVTRPMWTYGAVLQQASKDEGLSPDDRRRASSAGQLGISFLYLTWQLRKVRAAPKAADVKMAREKLDYTVQRYLDAAMGG